MAERKRSKDGRQEAQEIADQAGTGRPGRAGGRLAREVGTEDELKRTFERPASATRATKSDEKDHQKSDRQD